ncbi:START domain-containing protein 10-like [Dendronephthya gigantea]|uniref:START domain-containing protein 10-like n=1 Tax=Dendronephthya gigantea TaxID=151771 RepID=UPI001069F8CA|nr:START domain-containing protein 10-like [Dendronephthya gigantea]
MLAPVASPTNFERRSVSASQASLSRTGSLAGTLRRGASLRHEPRPYVSRNPIKEEDLDVILNWEADKSGECWQKIKSVREGDVWKKEMEDNKTWVLKAELTADTVPFKKAVELITEIKHRKEWDCLHLHLDVVETVGNGNFKVIYSQMKMPAFCKKREFLEAMSQRVSDKESNCYHLLAFRSTTHPSVPQSKDIIRADDQLSGIVIRPVGDGMTSSKVTFIFRIKFRGSAPRGMKKSYLANQSVEMVRRMKKYHEKKKVEERIGKV